MSSNMREIARRAGVSASAVSLALRGTGRISEETRQRICKVASEIGYQPHPLISKALSLARQPETARYRETFAFLVEFGLDDPTLDPFPVYQQRIQKGIEEQAHNLGYKIETFILPSGKPADHRRLSRVLHARGVRGIIVNPRLVGNQPRLHFDWAKFAAVEIGRTLWHPRNLHHVETSDYNKVIESLHLLKKAGYRRIGMAVEPEQNKHQRGVYYAAYLLAQLRQPPRQRIPILATTGKWEEKTFRHWYKQYKPDVLLIQDAETVPGWLKKMELSVPNDVSLFYCNAQDDRYSGSRRDYARMGHSAVDMLSLLLDRNLTGIPESPRCWLVDEIWQVGATLRHSIAPYLASDGRLLAGRLHHSTIS